MKLLLSGYYGFGNLGDEAILTGLVRALAARGHDLTVLSRTPEATRRHYGVAVRSRLLGALPALLECDALISGGGGLLQDATSHRSLQYYLGLVRLARRLGKRVVVYGQSVGPLSARGRQSVRRSLRGLPVAVRDEASQQLLAGLGVDAELCADAALLLPKPTGVKREDAVLLVPRAGYPEITAALSDLGQALRVRGQRLAAALVQADEDAGALEQLRRELPGLEHWPATNPAELLATTARASYVVSGRLHGLILAAVAGTGFTGLVYDPKVRAFLGEAGARAFELPVDQEALLHTVLAREAAPAERLRTLAHRAETGLLWLEQQLRA